jgi:hypothetical protein
MEEKGQDQFLQFFFPKETENLFPISIHFFFLTQINLLSGFTHYSKSLYFLHCHSKVDVRINRIVRKVYPGF